MKKLLLLIFLFSACGFAQQVAVISIDSKIFNEKRNLRVYLPAEYVENPQQRFEVVYVFDGQSLDLFDNVHSTLSQVNGQFPMIVVGVFSSESENGSRNRNTDFLPASDDPETVKRYGHSQTDLFLEFFSKEVTAAIASKYRILPFSTAIGHSNGGTFLAYSLRKNPELFNALIMLSPNLAFDKAQIVQSIAQFEPTFSGQKYIFMCNANENQDWVDARNKAIGWFERDTNRQKFHFENKDFSQTENHVSVVPIGLFYGLKGLIAYQFQDIARLKEYYNQLEQQRLIVVDAESLNTLSYNFIGQGKLKQAMQINDWAVERFPDDHNLFDSRGEFYEQSGDLGNAQKSYTKALKVLESVRKKMDNKTYAEKYAYYKGNADRLNKNK